MAIHPKCDFCNNELKDYGGLVFSPPNAENTVHKMHICKSCYEKIVPKK